MNRIGVVLCIGLILILECSLLVDAEELEGSIDVEVKNYIGLVCPSINIPSQNVTFSVEEIGDGGETTYMVNDTLEIHLNITDSSGRKSFVLPRSVMYSVVMVRSFSGSALFPIRGILSRLIPVRVLMKSVNVADSILGGKKSSTIIIPIKYELQSGNITGEDMTLYIVVMGFLPGDVNDIEGIPIVAFEKIELSISYAYS